MGDKNDRGWRVEPELAGSIERVLPDLAQEILDTIAREVPEYARPLEGSFGRGIRIGVDQALKQFVALVRDPSVGRGAGREVYVGLGRGELNQGRSLDSLQAAYRVGARVAWRRTSQAAERAGHSPEQIYQLADAIFAYIDELSSESVEGYAAAQSAREGEREMRRSRLLIALTSGAGTADVERLAAPAGWVVPTRAAAGACRPQDLGPIVRRLGPDILAAPMDDIGCLILADPDGPGAAERLEQAVGQRALTIGPTVAPEHLPECWQEAKEGHEARTTGELQPGAGLLRTDEHLTDLILAGHPERLRRIRTRLLAPLDGETAASRSRLEGTLSTWLRNQGGIGPTAEQLHVHPQTVRYRMARLRELLGEGLDDPDARFEIELSLRASKN